MGKWSRLSMENGQDFLWKMVRTFHGKWTGLPWKMDRTSMENVQDFLWKIVRTFHGKWPGLSMENGQDFPWEYGQDFPWRNGQDFLWKNRTFHGKIGLSMKKQQHNSIKWGRRFCTVNLPDKLRIQMQTLGSKLLLRVQQWLFPVCFDWFWGNSSQPQLKLGARKCDRIKVDNRTDREGNVTE